MLPSVMSQQDYIAKRNAALTELYEALKPHGGYDLNLTYGLISDKLIHVNIAGWVMNKLAWHNNARNRRDGLTTASLPTQEIVTKLLEFRQTTMKRLDVQALARGRSKLAYDFVKLLEADVNGPTANKPVTTSVPVLRANYSSAVNYINDAVAVDVRLETVNVTVKVKAIFQFEPGTSTLKEVLGTNSSGVNVPYKKHLSEVQALMSSFVTSI